VRRYCVTNSIDRLATLTFAPPFCTDPTELRAHMRRFVRRLRCDKGERFPYVWVPELHKDGERFHVHMGLADFIAKERLGELWGHGFVDVRRRRRRKGDGANDSARTAARYISKYVGKAFDAGQSIGCHRYEVAQGFQPRRESLVFDTEAEARAWLAEQMGGAQPSFVFTSSSVEDWQGPPVEVMFWS
jgi:hypothetical protein